MRTDFLYEGGIDIGNVYKNSGYQIKFANSNIYNTILIFLVYVLF